jgi:hypothetical protein
MRAWNSSSKGFRSNGNDARNLIRRLERLEARLAPAERRVLRILVTSVGEPDKMIELQLKPNDRQRQYWQRFRKRDE